MLSSTDSHLLMNWSGLEQKPPIFDGTTPWLFGSLRYPTVPYHLTSYVGAYDEKRETGVCEGTKASFFWGHNAAV
jgi:hypothetical protein